LSPRTRRPRNRSGARGDGSLPSALELRRRAFERYFARALPAASTRPRRLHEALRYAALSPGKRLRPLLALAACEAAGGAWRAALPAAAALECIHAFSLVHDDLPAMDDDDYRRGRPTTHKKYGEALGVLAGDALQAQAFIELGRLGARGVPPRRIVRAVDVLADAAGSRWLVGGQAMDLEAERRRVGLADVRAIHLRKTARLIQAALVLGGLAGGAAAPKLRALDSLGRDIGLAFQIHDDLLDESPAQRRLRHRRAGDRARGKATWPAVVGVEAARRTAGRLYARAAERVARLGPRARPLAALIALMAERR